MTIAIRGACKRFRGRGAAAFLALALAFLAPSAGAEPDPYRVDGVTVDTSASDAVAAREEAIERAQRQALATLIERLAATPEQAAGIDAASLSPSDYVRSYEVASERVAPTRYIGTFNVTFRPDAVDDILSSYGVEVVRAPVGPVLIIPAVQHPDELTLWPEDAVEWRQAWGGMPNAGTILEVVLPLGDLSDITAITPEQLAARDTSGAEYLSERYQAPAVVIAAVELDPAEEQDGLADEAAAIDPLPVRVTVTPLLGEALAPEPEVIELPAPAPTEDAWDVAARQTVARLESMWKAAHSIDFTGSASLVARVPLADLVTWAQVRQALSATPEVRDVRVERFSREAAEITMTYAGDVDNLVNALDQRGLFLFSENGQWLLQRVGGRLAPRGL